VVFNIVVFVAFRSVIVVKYEFVCAYVLCICCCCGPGSSVGIATDYGLDGSGSNPGGDEIFRPSNQALGPTSLL